MAATHPAVMLRPDIGVASDISRRISNYLDAVENDTKFTKYSTICDAECPTSSRDSGIAHSDSIHTSGLRRHFVDNHSTDTSHAVLDIVTENKHKLNNSATKSSIDKQFELNERLDTSASHLNSANLELLVGSSYSNGTVFQPKLFEIPNSGQNIYLRRPLRRSHCHPLSKRLSHPPLTKQPKTNKYDRRIIVSAESSSFNLINERINTKRSTDTNKDHSVHRSQSDSSTQYARLSKTFPVHNHDHDKALTSQPSQASQSPSLQGKLWNKNIIPPVIRFCDVEHQTDYDRASPPELKWAYQIPVISDPTQIRNLTHSEFFFSPSFSSARRIEPESEMADESLDRTLTRLESQIHQSYIYSDIKPARIGHYNKRMADQNTTHVDDTECPVTENASQPRVKCYNVAEKQLVERYYIGSPSDRLSRQRLSSSLETGVDCALELPQFIRMSKTYDTVENLSLVRNGSEDMAPKSSTNAGSEYEKMETSSSGEIKNSIATTDQTDIVAVVINEPMQADINMRTAIQNSATDLYSTQRFNADNRRMCKFNAEVYPSSYSEMMTTVTSSNKPVLQRWHQNNEHIIIPITKKPVGEESPEIAPLPTVKPLVKCNYSSSIYKTLDNIAKNETMCSVDEKYSFNNETHNQKHITNNGIVNIDRMSATANQNHNEYPEGKLNMCQVTKVSNMVSTSNNLSDFGTEIDLGEKPTKIINWKSENNKAPMFDSGITKQDYQHIQRNLYEKKHQQCNETFEDVGHLTPRFDASDENTLDEQNLREPRGGTEDSISVACTADEQTCATIVTSNVRANTFGLKKECITKNGRNSEPVSRNDVPCIKSPSSKISYLDNYGYCNLSTSKLKSASDRSNLETSPQLQIELDFSKPDELRPGTDQHAEGNSVSRSLCKQQPQNYAMAHKTCFDHGSWDTSVPLHTESTTVSTTSLNSDQTTITTPLGLTTNIAQTKNTTIHFEKNAVPHVNVNKTCVETDLCKTPGLNSTDAKPTSNKSSNKPTVTCYSASVESLSCRDDDDQIMSFMDRTFHYGSLPLNTKTATDQAAFQRCPRTTSERWNRITSKRKNNIPRNPSEHVVREVIDNVLNQSVETHSSTKPDSYLFNARPDINKVRRGYISVTLSPRPVLSSNAPDSDSYVKCDRSHSEHSKKRRSIIEQLAGRAVRSSLKAESRLKQLKPLEPNPKQTNYTNTASTNQMPIQLNEAESTNGHGKWKKINTSNKIMYSHEEFKSKINHDPKYADPILSAASKNDTTYAKKRFRPRRKVRIPTLIYNFDIAGKQVKPQNDKEGFQLTDDKIVSNCCEQLASEIENFLDSNGHIDQKNAKDVWDVENNDVFRQQDNSVQDSWRKYIAQSNNTQKQNKLAREGFDIVINPKGSSSTLKNNNAQCCIKYREEEIRRAGNLNYFESPPNTAVASQPNSERSEGSQSSESSVLKNICKKIRGLRNCSKTSSNDNSDIESQNAKHRPLVIPNACEVFAPKSIDEHPGNTMCACNNALSTERVIEDRYLSRPYAHNTDIRNPQVPKITTGIGTERSNLSRFAKDAQTSPVVHEPPTEDEQAISSNEPAATFYGVSTSNTYTDDTNHYHYIDDTYLPSVENVKENRKTETGTYSANNRKTFDADPKCILHDFTTPKPFSKTMTSVMYNPGASLLSRHTLSHSQNSVYKQFHSDNVKDKSTSREDFETLVHEQGEVFNSVSEREKVHRKAHNQVSTGVKSKIVAKNQWRASGGTGSLGMSGRSHSVSNIAHDSSTSRKNQAHSIPSFAFWAKAESDNEHSGSTLVQRGTVRRATRGKHYERYRSHINRKQSEEDATMVAKAKCRVVLYKRSQTDRGMEPRLVERTDNTAKEELRINMQADICQNVHGSNNDTTTPMSRGWSEQNSQSAIKHASVTHDTIMQKQRTNPAVSECHYLNFKTESKNWPPRHDVTQMNRMQIPGSECANNSLSADKLTSTCVELNVPTHLNTTDVMRPEHPREDGILAPVSTADQLYLNRHFKLQEDDRGEFIGTDQSIPHDTMPRPMVDSRNARRKNKQLSITHFFLDISKHANAHCESQNDNIAQAMIHSHHAIQNQTGDQSDTNCSLLTRSVPTEKPSENSFLSDEAHAAQDVNSTVKINNAMIIPPVSSETMWSIGNNGTTTASANVLDDRVDTAESINDGNSVSKDIQYVSSNETTRIYVDPFNRTATTTTSNASTSQTHVSVATLSKASFCHQHKGIPSPSNGTHLVHPEASQQKIADSTQNDTQELVVGSYNDVTDSKNNNAAPDTVAPKQSSGNTESSEIYTRNVSRDGDVTDVTSGVLISKKTHSTLLEPKKNNDIARNYSSTTAISEAGVGEKAITVVLKKGVTGLGLSLEGGKESPLGDRPLLIRKIFNGGAAYKSRRLHIGDRLIGVNGTDLTNMTHLEAWNRLKAAPDGDVVLMIQPVYCL